MLHPELSTRFAQERYKDYLRDAERDQLVALARRGRLTLPRRVARPLGRVLLRLGVHLLRYGLVETPATTHPYRPAERSIELN